MMELLFPSLGLSASAPCLRENVHKHILMDQAVGAWDHLIISNLPTRIVNMLLSSILVKTKVDYFKNTLKAF